MCFVVIDAGLAGVLSAIKLREAGFTDVTSPAISYSWQKTCARVMNA
jgi:hypothetical protein